MKDETPYGDFRIRGHIPIKTLEGKITLSNFIGGLEDMPPGD